MARRLLISRNGREGAVANNVLVKQPFNKLVSGEGAGGRGGGGECGAGRSGVARGGDARVVGGLVGVLVQVRVVSVAGLGWVRGKAWGDVWRRAQGHRLAWTITDAPPCFCVTWFPCFSAESLACVSWSCCCYWRRRWLCFPCFDLHHHLYLCVP